ncbi:MAG TPA: homoprotocatechuate degradation operon regulator HpaR [Xanthobacteraceae bacterium]|nr:homoprotocatechuate degradation operon regulator HpaR [Xanthobacteraceae bacterium]
MSKARKSPAMRPFARSLPMQLMRAREAVMRRFRPHLAAHGLSEQQWRVLRALIEADSLDILDLAGRCQIHPASLSRMLPKLSAAGLVTRRANASDQRRIVVSITGEGRALFEALAPESEAIYAAIEREIGGDRLRELYRSLDELINAIEDHSAAARAGLAAADTM